VCGAGNLFRHWVQMAEVCPGCGLHFQRIPGHWLGSWFLNVLVVQVAVVAVLIVGVATTFPDTPMVPIAAIGLVVAVVVPLAFFPISRTLWTAIDLAMRPLTFDEGVPPGFELEGDPNPNPTPNPDPDPDPNPDEP
jgi:uncharacterized protein (DUF983 family)